MDINEICRLKNIGLIKVYCNFSCRKFLYFVFSLPARESYEAKYLLKRRFTFWKFDSPVLSWSYFAKPFYRSFTFISDKVDINHKGSKWINTCIHILENNNFQVGLYDIRHYSRLRKLLIVYLFIFLKWNAHCLC